MCLHVTKMVVAIKTTEVFGDNERHYATQRLDLVTINVIYNS